MHEIVAAEDSMTFYMLNEVLLSALRFVKPFFERGAPVLVHCHDTTNRSAFVAVALLLLLEYRRLTDALNAVAAARCRMLSNRSFRAQLLEVALHSGQL